MEGEEGSQQPHLVLANNLFLLTHPDVPDIDKVQLRQDVFDFVIAHGKTITNNSVVSSSRKLIT